MQWYGRIILNYLKLQAIQSRRGHQKPPPPLSRRNRVKPCTTMVIKYTIQQHLYWHRCLIIRRRRTFKCIFKNPLKPIVPTIILSERALRRFTSYLTDRRQSVWINGETSETHQIALGFPQGSILWPLLFNIYINSLPKAVEKSRLIMYADDAVLFFTALEPLELQDALGRDYSLISKWYTDNRLTLNVKKTKLMLAGSKTLRILSSYLTAAKYTASSLLNTSE